MAEVTPITKNVTKDIRVTEGEGVRIEVEMVFNKDLTRTYKSMAEIQQAQMEGKLDMSDINLMPDTVIFKINGDSEKMLYLTGKEFSALWQVIASFERDGKFNTPMITMMPRRLIPMPPIGAM